MYCKNCGKLIKLEDKFCGNCGQKILYNSEYKNKEEKNKPRPKEKLEDYIKDEKTPLENSNLNSGKEESAEEINDENTSNSGAIDLSEEDIEKNKKTVIRAGKFSEWLGWIRIFLPFLGYIFLESYKSTEEGYIEGAETTILNLPNIILSIFQGFLLLILGGRIKQQSPYMKRYIVILICILVPTSILASLSSIVIEGEITSGNTLSFILVLYLFCALFSANKLLKSEKYKKTLQKVDYKIKWFHWVLIAIGVSFIFILSSFA